MLIKTRNSENLFFNVADLPPVASHDGVTSWNKPFLGLILTEVNSTCELARLGVNCLTCRYSWQ